jgi:hypothetical protein
LLSRSLSIVTNFIEQKRSAGKKERLDVFFLVIPEPSDKNAATRE